MSHFKIKFAGLPAMLLGFLFLVLLPVGVAGADYYWIGGGGNWSDVSRWRTATGGSSLPGAGDHVIFDANSGFTASGNNVVVINVDAECFDMTWSGAPNNPVLRGTENLSVSIYGSLTLQTGMLLELDQPGFAWKFTGTGEHTIASNGNLLTAGNWDINGVFRGGVYFDGTGGRWRLTDDFSADWSVIFLRKGVIDTDGHTLQTRRLSSLTIDDRGLILGSSKVIIGEMIAIENDSFMLNASSSEIIFAGYPGLSSNLTVNIPGLEFNDVVFAEPDASFAVLSGNNTRFNNLRFHGDAVIRGECTFNRLVFAPGKEYLLYGGMTELTIIDEFVASGNPCFNTIIESQVTIPGNISTIRKASGRVDVHFVELNGIHAEGGATFTAINSVDAGNNTGWVFQDDLANSFLTLGPDIMVNCDEMPYTLSTASLFPNQGATYQWDDPLSSTGSELVAGEFREYSVIVTYDASCPSVTARIELISPPLPSVNLGNDTIICDGCELELDAGSGPLYTYLWEPNGEETQKIMVNASGTYRVVVTNEFGCEAEDEIEVTVMTPVFYFIPNAFKPGSDYIDNRIFAPVFPDEVLDYNMWIYNRWGQLVFQSGVAGQTWDGTHEGSEAPQGTYRYVIEVKQPWDYTEKRIGIVTLLR